MFTVRANDHGGKRTVRLNGSEFLHRFLLHVLPTGSKRIRHYGVLASACKGVKLQAARLALQMPALNPQAIRPRLSWRGWPRRMWACARVARWAGCWFSLRWRGLGDCLDRPAPCTSQPGAAMNFCLAWISGLVGRTLAGVRCSVARGCPHAWPARTDSQAGRGLACSFDHLRGQLMQQIPPARS